MKNKTIKIEDDNGVIFARYGDRRSRIYHWLSVVELFTQLGFTCERYLGNKLIETFYPKKEKKNVQS